MSTLLAGFIAPCLPTKADTLPSGGLWVHEIKHDGFPHYRPQEWRTGEALQSPRQRPDGPLRRREPLDVRKATLRPLLVKTGPSLRWNEHIEGDGETIFRHACKLGL
jgi:ATP-dependent DNA ligase